MEKAMEDKKFGLLIEEPNLYLCDYKIVLNKIIEDGLKPMIILNEKTSTDNGYVDINMKKMFFKNVMPCLRESDFIIIRNHPNNNMVKWTSEIKNKILSLDFRFFGLEKQNNLNKFILYTNIDTCLDEDYSHYLFGSSLLSFFVKNLLDIVDIRNLRDKNNYFNCFDFLSQERSSEDKMLINFV